MKRVPQSLFLALFVFAVSGFAQTQPQPAATEELWKEFSSTAGGFKVDLLVGDPTETSETIESSLGKIKRHTITLETGMANFLVEYSDLPVTLAKPDQVKDFLGYMSEDIIVSFQGKLQNMIEIEFDGHPGRELIAETPNSMVRAKLYLVGERFYRIAVLTPKIARSIESFTSRFFDSFKLTGKPAPADDETVKAVAVNAEGKAVAVKKVDPGAALKKAQSGYPKEARDAGVSGAVKVQVLISEQGRVIEAIAISGPELLREAAVKAAKQWVFKPTRVDNRPVKVQGILTVNFELQ
jgi:TonB family protein